MNCGTARTVSQAIPERSTESRADRGWTALKTFKEIGLARLTQREWFGAFAPKKGASAATIEFASAELATAVHTSDVREAWHKVAIAPEGTKASELLVALRKEHDF